MFVDLAWGGQQGQVIYPPCVNGKVVRTVKQIRWTVNSQKA